MKIKKQTLKMEYMNLYIKLITQLSTLKINNSSDFKNSNKHDSFIIHIDIFRMILPWRKITPISWDWCEDHWADRHKIYETVPSFE